MPAVRAILGFIVNHFLTRNSEGDQVAKTIIDKLRTQAPEVASDLQRLTPAQLDKKLKLDHGSLDHRGRG